MNIPDYVINEIVIPYWKLYIYNPVYKLDDIYFKNTTLSAYNVYVKHDGIYIKFNPPNDYYVCEGIYGKDENLLISYCYYNTKYEQCYMNTQELLKSLDLWICSWHLGKLVKTNKYGG